jgi:hypothetical protein
MGNTWASRERRRAGRNDRGTAAGPCSRPVHASGSAPRRGGTLGTVQAVHGGEVHAVRLDAGAFPLLLLLGQSTTGTTVA